MPDQVGRGRSGFNQAVFNNARAGSTPPASQPAWLRFSDESVWPNFRFGPKPGQPFSDSQFPVSAVDELSKQGVLDVTFGRRPQPQPDLQGIGRSRRSVEWCGVDGTLAVGIAPLARRCSIPPMKGLVLVEPGSRPATTPPNRLPRWPRCRSWSCSAITATRRQACPRCPHGSLFRGGQAMIGRIKEAGGQAQMLSPAEIGARGNSHMIMQDKNNLQVADLILKWIGERVGKPSGQKK